MGDDETKQKFVKTPLLYQLTEYDCGTAIVSNALRYLFYRAEICPEVLKHLVQYTLDVPNGKGENCKGGTSTKAMYSLCEWLNENGPKRGMNLHCVSLPQAECSIYNQTLEKSIHRGGIAIVRVYQNLEHYCLLTKLDSEYAYLFDPYYLSSDFQNKDSSFEVVKDKPFEYNRKVLKTRMDEKSGKDFSLVEGENQQIIIIERS